MSSKNKEETTRTDPAWVVDAVQRIQSGRDKDECFRLLFDEYFDYARRWLQGRGLRPQTAEDLAQDAMVRVYRGIERFRWQSSFNTWTLRIVSNVYKNHLRHMDTARPTAESESLDRLLDEEALGERALLPESMASTNPDPQTATLAAERRRQLSDALDALPSRMRQCFLLRFQGFKYIEIARMLDIKVDTVKKQLAEARRRLRPSFGTIAGLFSALCLWVQ